MRSVIEKKEKVPASNNRSNKNVSKREKQPTKKYDTRKCPFSHLAAAHTENVVTQKKMYGA